MENNKIYRGDFTVVSISEIKTARSGNFYREIVFDRHPNKRYHGTNVQPPKVREFHENEADFVDISVGQVLHNVQIYAKMMSMKLPGKLYVLDAFDNIILNDKRMS